MTAENFIKKTFNLDVDSNISKVPDLPIAMVIRLLENYKSNKIDELSFPDIPNCIAPNNILPCRHYFGGMCQYNGFCNFKQNKLSI